MISDSISTPTLFLAILAFLHFHINFRICWSIPTKKKKSLLDYNWDSIEYVEDS